MSRVPTRSVARALFSEQFPHADRNGRLKKYNVCARNTWHPYTKTNQSSGMVSVVAGPSLVLAVHLTFTDERPSIRLWACPSSPTKTTRMSKIQIMACIQVSGHTSSANLSTITQPPRPQEMAHPIPWTHSKVYPTHLGPYPPTLLRRGVHTSSAYLAHCGMSNRQALSNNHLNS